jgi:hypothetical protein
MGHQWAVVYSGDHDAAEHEEPEGMTNRRLLLCQHEGNSLGQSRAAMAEVQICGIPKLRMQEVAPTP